MVTDLIIPMPHEAVNRPARFASLATRIDHSVLRHIVASNNDPKNCCIGQARNLDPTRTIRLDATESLEMWDRTYGWRAKMKTRAALPGWSVALITAPCRTRRAGKNRIRRHSISTIRPGTRATVTIGASWRRRHAVWCAASVHHTAR